MRIIWQGFNTYLLLAAVVGSLCACGTTSKRKNFSALRIHLETNRDGTDRSKAVPILRDKSQMINVESAPFLAEGNVAEAKLVDEVGGFAVEIKFERRGVWLLESYTTANRGRRLAIYAEFADPADPERKKIVSRWLAAPLVQKRISDGVLTFTPDASREEMTEWVRGLNLLAKKLASSWTERQ